MSTIFSKIISGELPCDKVFENDRIIAFKDINPQAPVHLLIVPKEEIKNLQEVTPEQMPVITEILEVAQQLAKKFEVESGYRLLTNIGEDGGQTVFHLHFHLIGGTILKNLV
ncbi:MAG: HIT domain-containing protein [Chlamydiales bacterium]|nr:HIT domain-containing protein [Chlamydiales bacterium]